MQKAYAAFAAAESGHGASISTVPPADSLAAASASPVENALPEPAVPVPATAAPEAAQSLAVVASAATEAVSAAAEQLEAVAASYVPQNEPSPGEPAVAAEATIASAQVEKEPDQKTVSAEPATEAIEGSNANPDMPQPEAQELRAEESKQPAPLAEASPAPIDEVSVEASASQEVTQPAESKPEPSQEIVNREPDYAATTAAAWASWHRIRESDSQDGAAKAVAAGAESNPSDVSAETESDPGIASIVDSVLADLRPKIVEEISKKLGKKK